MSVPRAEGQQRRGPPEGQWLGAGLWMTASPIPSLTRQPPNSQRLPLSPVNRARLSAALRSSSDMGLGAGHRHPHGCEKSARAHGRSGR